MTSLEIEILTKIYSSYIRLIPTNTAILFFVERPQQKAIQGNRITKTYNALWASPVKIDLKIKKKNMVIYCSGGQICSITGSWSPGLSFKTLKSKFECITNFIFQFWGFLAKLRENINLQEIYLGEVSLGGIYKPCGSTRGREGGCKISTLLIKPI